MQIPESWWLAYKGCNITNLDLTHNLLVINDLPKVIKAEVCPARLTTTPDYEGLPEDEPFLKLVVRAGQSIIDKIEKMPKGTAGYYQGELDSVTKTEHDVSGARVCPLDCINLSPKGARHNYAYTYVGFQDNNGKAIVVPYNCRAQVSGSVSCTVTSMHTN